MEIVKNIKTAVSDLLSAHTDEEVIHLVLSCTATEVTASQGEEGSSASRYECAFTLEADEVSSAFAASAESSQMFAIMCQRDLARLARYRQVLLGHISDSNRSVDPRWEEERSLEIASKVIARRAELLELDPVSVVMRTVAIKPPLVWSFWATARPDDQVEAVYSELEMRAVEQVKIDWETLNDPGAYDRVYTELERFSRASGGEGQTKSDLEGAVQGGGDLLSR